METKREVNVQFPHKCTECDYTNTFSIEYPYLEYETINL